MDSLKIIFEYNTDENIDRKNKKKPGFTLIELIAVISIIGILVTILLPKFTGYINEAKKLVVIDQSRKVIMAVESYNIKATDPISSTKTIKDIKEDSKINKYFEGEKIDKLKDELTLGECQNIVNGNDFDLKSVCSQKVSDIPKVTTP